MRKTTKKYVIVSLVAASVALLGASFSVKPVSANAESCLLSAPTTSIRLQNTGTTTGIRFGSQIATATYQTAGITEVGALVAPNGSYTGALTLQNTDTDIRKIVVEGTVGEEVRNGKFTLKDGNYQYRAYVSSIPAKHYATKLDIVYYYTVEGGAEYYTSCTTTCVEDVAMVALNDVQATQDDTYRYQVADGIYSRFVESERETLISFLPSYQITIPEGVTVVSSASGALKAEENVVTTFKGDKVTFTKTLAANTKIDFLANDSIVNTVCENNIATTTNFTVTGDTTVTFKTSYLVSEQTHNYNLVYADGAYTAGSDLDAGGYLEGASVAAGKTFMVKVNVSGMTMDSLANAGLLVGTEGTNFVEFTLRNGNISPDRYDFTIRRRGDVSGSTQIYKRYTFTNSELQSNALGADDAGMAMLELVYHAENYYIFINGIEAFVLNENTDDMVESGTNAKFSIKDVIGTGTVKLGLFIDGKASLSNWSYTTDESTILNAYLKRNITLPEGTTASVGGNTLDSDGNVVTAVKGDKVTLSKTIPENTNIAFMVNGQEIETVCEGTTATATFTVTENVEVTYQETYLLSGVITNQISAYTLDYSTVEVKVMNGDTEVASITPDNTGKFSVYVPNGNYTVSAVCNALASDSLSVSVADTATDNLEIVLDTPLFVSEFGLYSRTFHYENGVYHNEIADSTNGGNVGGYLAGAVAAEGAAFAIETELYDFATDGSPRGGFVVGSTTASNQFMSFTLRRRGDGTFDFARERIAGINGSTQVYAQNFFNTGVADTTTQTYLNNTPFGTNGTEKVKMALVYYHGDYYIFFNDVLTFIFNENTNDLASNTTSIKSAIGTGAVKFGLFAMEKPVHFTNWSYLVDEASVVSKYFPEGEEVISTVGKNNRTLYYDNGSYNNKIPDMNAYSTAGIYLAGAVAAENQTFAMEVTVSNYADVSGLGAGFIVGSATGAKTQFMAFALRRFGAGDTGCFDFVQERVAGIDGSTRVYGRSTFTDSTLANYNRTGPLTMALVYKDNTYNIFFKLEEGYVKAFAFNENTTLDGGDLKQSTKTTIGTGAVRFGLYASEGGYVRLTDWSYSLDETAINEKYFA